MISVCMTTYNGSKYIIEQLESILCQLSKDDEIIVSDDTSTDDTIEKIKSLNDPRIKILHHRKVKHKFKIDLSTHNFENAIKAAQGDYIFLSDQDDKWLPNKVTVMLSYLKNYDLVNSDCYVTRQNLEIQQDSYFAQRKPSYNILRNIWKSTFLGSCMAFKKEILEKAYPFPQYGFAHDLWLGLIALKWYKVKFIQQPLILYRRHNSTVTANGRNNKNSPLFKIKYRLYILKDAIKRHVIV
ncbi:Spore coat polysaccharide biosynthesis protein spsA [Segatella buccae]|uniref:Spore coat polysaccharide biosynthesis protein spsA n=1 Tax=Segatella buccae TaxID=28126 RepID=A0AAQ1UHQ2_9BACT|nr:glycosyltransferase [Segatella buccae]SUB79650.1 Spore coat polysaccharide biosynthesis protein spsA [Segatella buccae]